MHLRYILIFPLRVFWKMEFPLREIVCRRLLSLSNEEDIFQETEKRGEGIEWDSGYR